MTHYRNLQGTRSKMERMLHNMFVGPYGSGWPKGDIPLLSVWHDANLSLFHADQRVLVFSISEEDLSNQNFDAVQLVDAG